MLIGINSECILFDYLPLRNTSEKKYFTWYSLILYYVAKILTSIDW